MSLERAQAAILVSDPDDVSIKRIAWAFGCAKKDSDEESQLYRLLVEKMRRILRARGEEG